MAIYFPICIHKPEIQKLKLNYNETDQIIKPFCRESLKCTDYIPNIGERPPHTQIHTKGYPGYDTKLHLTLWFQFGDLEIMEYS